MGKDEPQLAVEPCTGQTMEMARDALHGEQFLRRLYLHGFRHERGMTRDERPYMLDDFLLCFKRQVHEAKFCHRETRITN